MKYKTLFVLIFVNILFFLSIANVIAFLITEDWTLANTPWPTHRHDQQRTGQSSYYGVTTQPLIKWESNTGLTASGITVGISNTLYVRSLFTTALDFDGNVIFSDLPGGVCSSTPTQSGNGNLYYHTTFSFISINRKGDILWEIPFSSGCNHSTANIDENGILYVGLNGRYSAIDLANATVLWDYPVHPFLSGGTPALGPDGTIYVNLSATGENGQIIALNPNGTIKWENSEYGFTTNPVVGADGIIYSGGYIYNNDDYRGALTAFSPDGKPIWHFYVPEVFCTEVGPAIGTDGTIYFGTVRNEWYDQEASFYAVNPDGTLKWDYKIYRDGWPRICSTPTVDVNNNVYFCADTGRCYAFDENGKKLWELLIEDGFELRGSPTILRDGLMVLPSSEGVLAIIPSTKQIYLPVIKQSEN